MFKMIMTAVVALGCAAAFANEGTTGTTATTPAATGATTGAPTGDAAAMPAEGHDAHAKNKKMAKKEKAAKKGNKMDKGAEPAKDAPAKTE
jgi:hypothetical protein